MIGAAVRVHLLMAGAKAAAAAAVDAPGAAAAIALEAQLAVHAAMAIASPQALAGQHFLPSAEFETVCRIAVELETAIGEIAAKHIGTDDFSDALWAISGELLILSGDAPATRGARRAVLAAPEGVA